MPRPKHRSVAKPARFDEWIATYFLPYDRVASPWDKFPPGGAERPPLFVCPDDDELVELFTFTMLASGEELAQLSDWQLGNGLKLLLEDVFCPIAERVRDGRIHDRVRARAIGSLKVLYSDCLAKRVKPHLAFRREHGSCAPLDYVCFMMWDTSPLADWTVYERRRELEECILDVLEHALDSDNEAVVESGLHGLGHAVHSKVRGSSELIEDMIRRRGGSLSKPLLQYARQAQGGAIL